MHGRIECHLGQIQIEGSKVNMIARSLQSVLSHHRRTRRRCEWRTRAIDNALHHCRSVNLDAEGRVTTDEARRSRHRALPHVRTLTTGASGREEPPSLTPCLRRRPLGTLVAGWVTPRCIECRRHVGWRISRTRQSSGEATGKLPSSSPKRFECFSMDLMQAVLSSPRVAKMCGAHKLHRRRPRRRCAA
jgi:hypothetical protein